MYPRSRLEEKKPGFIRKNKRKISKRKSYMPSRGGFSQCFDAIIRQVTIECLKIGLLLLRIRDQIKMTIALYQTLYENDILFGIRKQLQAEEEKEELKKKKLIDKKLKLENKLKAFDKQIAERNEKIENSKREKF